MRTGKLLPALMLLALSVSTAQAQYGQPGYPGSPSSRTVPLKIRIVFLGLDSSDLDPSYLVSGVNSIPVKYQSVVAGPINTGVVFNFTYQILYADATFTTSFANFLNSIAVVQNSAVGPEPLPPALFNPYFDNSTTQLGTVQNYFYNATLVESWLASNQTQFGPIPVPGYTLFVADLHNYGVPSFTYSQYQAYTAKCVGCIKTVAQAHYYNRTVTDHDLGQVLYRHYMTGWGGSQRSSYIDLSAGPSYWPRLLGIDELPIQVASSLNQNTAGTNPSSPYAKIWTANFVNDYITGAVYNLFGPDQLYPVFYAQKYVFNLFVFDNRTDQEMIQGPKLSATIDRNFIRDRLSTLVPFANVTVNLNLHNVTDYPGLAAAVANATTKVKDPVLDIPIVDARPVYNWLSNHGLGHINQFVNETEPSFSEYDIPAFLFAFQGNYTFAFTYKEEILSEAPRSITGVALGDLVLIDQSNATLTGLSARIPKPGKGLGFTVATIHELGHMMGLNHPFQAGLPDPTQDFTNTVMGYYPYSDSYSAFDKDTILRGVNDELLIIANVTLAGTASSLFNTGTIARARSEMRLAENSYQTMDYAVAVPHSYAAALNALEAQASGAFFSFFTPLIYGLIGLAAGLGLGLLVGYLFFRRRPSRGVQYYKCPTCGQPLRWDPAAMRWYCDREQRHI